MASVLKVDKLDPQSGTALEIGSSGDTITIPSGATFTQSGTMNASAITAGTVATARLGTGTASSTTVLYGDQTYKTEPGGTLVKTGSLTTTGDQTSAELTDCFTDTYQTYHIYIKSMNTATAAGNINFRFKTSAGDYTTTQHRFACRFCDDGGDLSVSTGVDQAQIVVATTTENTFSRGGYSGFFICEHPTSTAVSPKIYGTGGWYQEGGGQIASYLTGITDTQIDATGMNIYPSTGAWTDGGQVFVYGVTE